jgi:hypothetical protein
MSSKKSHDMTANEQNAATAVAEQIREFVSSGKADSALAPLRDERDSAVSELRRAQELDPNKLRRTVSI